MADDLEGDELLYVSLQDYEDSQAGMAGTMEAETDRGPAVSGLSLSMKDEYETSMFDFGDTDPVIGMNLTISDGKLVPASDGDVIVGTLTSVPKGRWVNNATAKSR